ncbi:MAG: sugar phosphate isomerase/epimerase [Thermoplasmata archaeon]|jgi:hypothetical protein|nr:sugar phosphate isomerase/epimerase [Thermoplasmata archaeon]
MNHLFSYSVYQKTEDLAADLPSLFREIKCDGLELLTSHEPIDPSLKGITKTVHLPYTTDWLAPWEGRAYEMSDYYAKYYMYGRDRDEVVSTIRSMIGYAAAIEPLHGVIHASNVNLTELHLRKYTGDCRDILCKFAEVMNTAIAGMKGGEPPFRLVFENLWWPGLRMLDNSDFHLLEKKIEFENWGICLDTGHLMNTLPGIYSEQDGINAVLRIIDGYSQDTKDAISAMHFHYSASSEYRTTFEEKRYEGGPIGDFISGCYKHITTLDQHLPYTDPRCREIVEAIKPENLIHELPGHGHDPLLDYRQQRALLD